MNVVAALRLIVAASDVSNKEELFNDSLVLYDLYSQVKGGKFDLHRFAQSDRLKPTIQAAANVLDAISDLADNPTHLDNIIDLLTSL